MLGSSLKLCHVTKKLAHGPAAHVPVMQRSKASPTRPCLLYGNLASRLSLLHTPNMCPLSSHIYHQRYATPHDAGRKPSLCHLWRLPRGWWSQWNPGTNEQWYSGSNEWNSSQSISGHSLSLLHGKSSSVLSKTAGINEIQNISKPTLRNSIKKDGRTKGNSKEQSDGTVVVKSYLGVSSLLQIGPTTATPSTVGPPQTWPSLRLIHSISPCGSCPTKIALLTAGFEIRGYHAKQIHPPCNLQIFGVKSPKILFPLLGSNSCNSLRALSMLRAFWLSKSPGRSPVKGVK